jgi:hypothetical protein
MYRANIMRNKAKEALHTASIHNTALKPELRVFAESAITPFA